MKFINLSMLSALCLATVQGAALEKRSSKSWAGSNLYFLHGLSASDQADYIETLASYGTKVVRVWVTGLSTGCVKGSNVVTAVNDLEPNAIRSYDDSVLQALDKVLAQFVSKGIKAIVSPHDGNAFGYNSCDVYAKKYASCGANDSAGSGFYSSVDAKSDYDARMAHVLNYVSPSSGKKWGKWKEAILAFNIQNEPFQQAGSLASQNDPDDWLCGRAGNMKKIIGGSGVLLATGGVGGDQSHGTNLMDKAVRCSALDIISIHGYVGTANFWTSYLPKSESTVAAAGKKLMVEEWGVATSYQDDFDKQAAAITATGTPWTYWQMIPGSDGASDCSSGCCTGYDGFEIGVSSSKGNLKAAVQAAAAKAATQDWTGSVY